MEWPHQCRFHSPTPMPESTCCRFSYVVGVFVDAMLRWSIEVAEKLDQDASQSALHVASNRNCVKNMQLYEKVSNYPPVGLSSIGWEKVLSAVDFNLDVSIVWCRCCKPRLVATAILLLCRLLGAIAAPQIVCAAWMWVLHFCVDIDKDIW